MDFIKSIMSGNRRDFQITAGRVLKALVVVCLVPALSGCATFKEKFQPKTKANVGIFADTTLSMLSQAELAFDKSEAVYVREFFDLAGKEELRLIKLNQETNGFIRGIIKYSLELVVITESHDNAADQIKAYAEYISRFNEEALKRLGFDKERYAKVIEEVRQQTEFMDALRKAQPIINNATRYVNQLLDEKNVAIEELERKLDLAIDQRFADVIQYQAALEKEKYAVLRSLGQIYGTFKGDLAAFDRLIQSGSIRKKGLIPKGRPTDDDLIVIAEHLMQRLKALHLIGTEISPDWETYRATHRELDKLYGQAIERLNRTRLLTLVWLRAHQKMAAGVQSPAEWFNINDLPSEMFKLGTRAIF